jgi:RNA polymerase sigma-70 factor (ECF subfamily)
MNALMDDQERTVILVDHARAGDREAFDRLLARFQGRLRSTVESWSRFQLGAKIEVDDLLQESFVRAFRSLERFEWQGDDSFFRWLCGITKRTLAQAIQEQRASHVTGSHSSAAGSGPTPTKISRRVERFERLEEALQSLTPEYREVLLLSRVEGLKTKEIAARMNRSPNAVKHLIARALRALRKRFGDTESLNLPRDRQFDVERGNHEQ